MSEEIPSKMDKTIQPTSIGAPSDKVPIKYEDIKKILHDFYSSKDYECKMHFNKGFNATVSEDYDKIDLLCNIIDQAYNLISNNPDLTQQDKKTFKDLTKGIILLNKSMKQYDTDDTKLFVAQISGYILKLIRNNFHD